MPNDERVYFLSERDGYFHLYVTGLDGGEPTQLTSGRFGLVDLRLSKENERWFLSPTRYTRPRTSSTRCRSRVALARG